MKPVDMVVDGNSLYARAFWANSRDTANPDLVLRSCLLTVFSLLTPLGERIGTRFDRMVFCWDGDHKRDKGDRKPKPPCYHETKEDLQGLLTDVLGAAHAKPPAHEADDAIGTIVYNNWDQARDIYVVSGDKDLMQLHGGNVHYYSLNEQALMSSAVICRKFHVKKPSQIAIALAIMGDSVDNIKGIRGWGPKKVAGLFQSVPRDADFQEALAIIQKLIPPEHQDNFWDSLERTLLDTELKDLPDPAPIKFARMSLVDNLDLPGVVESYGRLLSAYDDDEDDGDDQEDV